MVFKVYHRHLQLRNEVSSFGLIKSLDFKLLNFDQQALDCPAG